MSGLFGGGDKEESSNYKTVYDPFAGVRGKTSSWLESQIGKTAEPYTGQLVAPKTAQETQSLDYLNKYATQPTSEQTTLAQNEVKKTLTGGYDPTTSPYYQAMKAEASRNLGENLEGISSDAAGGGRYWSGARLGQQGEARTDMGNALNTILGQLSESERNRMTTASQQAQSLGEEQTNQPLKVSTALQSLGSLDRNLSQAQNEAIYNEWLRQQNYPLQIAGLASPYATYSPTMQQTGYSQNSGLNSLLGNSGLGSSLGSLIGGLFSKKTTASTPSTNVNVWGGDSGYY